MNLKFLLKVANKLDNEQSQHTVMAANAIDMAIQESKNSVGSAYFRTLDKLAQFATMLDVDGHLKVADILDVVLNKAAQTNNDYSHLYDSKAHREQTLFQALVDEASEAKEPSMETWQGTNPSLLTRYSPDYPGVMMQRISDGVYQDLLSKKVYDFNSGFISDTGERYYGGSVAHQTPTAMNYQNSPQVLESKHLRTRPR
jgi:hypothetical protein